MLRIPSRFRTKHTFSSNHSKIHATNDSEYYSSDWDHNQLLVWKFAEFSKHVNITDLLCSCRQFFLSKWLPTYWPLGARHFMRVRNFFYFNLQFSWWKFSRKNWWFSGFFTSEMRCNNTHKLTFQVKNFALNFSIFGVLILL